MEVAVNGAIAVRRAVLCPLKPGIMRDGEVTCKPSKEVCQKAYIGPGDTATLDVGAGDRTTQHVIKVERAGS